MRNNVKIEIAPQLDHVQENDKFVWFAHFDFDAPANDSNLDEYDALMQRVKLGYQDHQKQNFEKMKQYNDQQTDLHEQLKHNPELIKRLLTHFPFWTNIDEFDNDLTVAKKLIEYGEQRFIEEKYGILPEQTVATIKALDDEGNELANCQANFKHLGKGKYQLDQPNAVLTVSKAGNVSKMIIQPINIRCEALVPMSSPQEVAEGHQITMDQADFQIA